MTWGLEGTGLIQGTHQERPEKSSVASKGYLFRRKLLPREEYPLPRRQCIEKCGFTSPLKRYQLCSSSLRVSPTHHHQCLSLMFPWYLGYPKVLCDLRSCLCVVV